MTTDDDIIREAIARHASGVTITDGQARVIASAWHGGQTSALCALATSGAITDGAGDEIRREMRNGETGAEELPALLDYVTIHGPRGPMPPYWHTLWG